jgi:hypothetical protein
LKFYECLITLVGLALLALGIAMLLPGCAIVMAGCEYEVKHAAKCEVGK